MRRILRCSACNVYTMKDLHDCGSKSILPVPAKWSPEDKYGKYRREVKKEELKEKGLV
jgi:H/ACA ribonucleoprotein complex subunit 3